MIFDPRLREQNFGECQGLTVEEITKLEKDKNLEKGTLSGGRQCELAGGESTE